MKKVMMIVLGTLVFASLASAQSFVKGAWGTGTTDSKFNFNMDKLGPHQNGGRGCVGCHAPHSGARGNGGAMTGWDGTKFTTAVTTTGDTGDEVLWGQDLGPVLKKYDFPVNPDNSKVAGLTGEVDLTGTGVPERQITGIAMCLSCHDGNVAGGAMMKNASYSATVLSGYGKNAVPTLLGNDGGTINNYENDHPVGVTATLGSVGHGAIGNCADKYYDCGTTPKPKNYFVLNTNAAGQKFIDKGTAFANSPMAEFAKNYGLPLTVDARVGAGWVVDDATNVKTVDDAYVVCTTCHTPHSYYTTSVNNVKYGGVNTGTYPTYFFIAAAYNPNAQTSNGSLASSATQFCRQCHFSGPGGANEASGISIQTAF